MGQTESLNSNSSISKKVDKDGSDSIQFTINDVPHIVHKNQTAYVSLNVYIRDVANLKGTKSMCLEGGCGACIVAAQIRNSDIISVNSCLVPVLLCDGWKITTIEGLGNKKSGYHTLQAALAGMNGSQCGYCSPGWVMSMYSVIQNEKIKMEEVENSFASNICRCTGYRPILDAFKSFAVDAPPTSKKIRDIEDMYNVSGCKKCTKKICNNSCEKMEIIDQSSFPRSLELKFHEVIFHKILDIKDIFKIFQKYPKASFILNGGNTGHGVYRTKNIQVCIDINDVQDLHRVVKDEKMLTLGANVSLSTAKSTFEKFMTDKNFSYLKQMAEHIDLVASIPIRNIGTIGGNLMMKNHHNEFPSDIFLIFETAGAKIHILDSPSLKNIITFVEFLKLKMHMKLMYSIELPALDEQYHYKSYKTMPRAQNAHAIINAGFLFKLDHNGQVLEKPNILFGGIKPEFLHASETEQFFIGKHLFNNNDLSNGLKLLYSELEPDYVLPDYKANFRKLLATCLFYKFVLSINSNAINSKLKSGGTLLQRGLSSGKQDFDTDRNIWPVNQPIPKIESLYQTSGEAEYVNDIPIKNNEVFCALTLAEAPGILERIHYQEALDINGVIAFYCAKDVPGKNAYINSVNQYFFLEEDELLFAENEVSYAGQPYGMIVAENQNVALYAASLVKIVYPNGPRQKPMITVHDVIASNDKTRMNCAVDWPAKEPAGTNVKHTFKGFYECGTQYHFTMESQSCVCEPVEDGINIHPATQWMDLIQASVATLLNLPMHSVNVKVRRLGGSYGAKISRSSQIACACALACHKLNRPARMILTIEDNMRALGKRTASFMEYEVSTDDSGKIQQMDVNYWGNVGASFNESHSMLTAHHFYNCYDFSTWSIKGFDVKTNLPGNTWCRAPGSTEGIATVEQIMDRIAKITKQDPINVRIINMNEEDKTALVPMIEELKKTSDYDNRVALVKEYNQNNRWKKKGISMVPMKYPLWIFGQYHSLVSIYARDGTVSITHAGIEMGQGIHTKVAQVAAHILGIDLKMINVKPSISWTTPNSFVTGGSLGSDALGYATLRACKILLERLQPIKDSLGGKPKWGELIMAAHNKNVDLCASFMFNAEQDVKNYPIYGVTVSEVEIDVLTGQHLISRVDILEDAGVSLSPEIDVGQVEGAFVMGIGFWTSEELIYDPETGGLTNYRTWNYKVPGAKDIPVDFRVSFRRNAPNPLGVLSSKTAGEPPLCMSCSIPLAIRQALDSARADAGNSDTWYQLDNQLSTEKILLSSLTKVEDLQLN
ncbi:hypothetical protein TKK_0014241 [Trichogramma kaykai]|uniref:FAD-binding PCMH-type domain-containing protein n=1 Tax=Trichogramma kaykai TaxID=54128 RepID=A0ABD2WDU7_9HYME